jgi:hypothetical protein
MLEGRRDDDITKTSAKLKDWKFATYGKCTSQSASTGGAIFSDHFEETVLTGRVTFVTDT